MTGLLSFKDDGVQFAWDSTSISAFEKCPRYYYLRHIEGWQPIGRSVHLLFGGWYARALEHYYKHLATGATPDEALLHVVRDAMLETWSHDLDDEGNRIEGTGEPWNSLHNTKTRDTLIRSIVWYFDHFADDPTTTLQLESGPAVELSFALPVENDIIFCGHIDRMVEYAGDPYVMDQKTTGGTISPKFFNDFTPDIQMSMYSYAGQIIFHIPVKGVIIDGAQIAVGFTRFERGFANRPRPLLDEWYESTMATIERAQTAARERFYPMNRTACGNYGGCDFRNICARSPQHRKNFLEQGYERAPRWDPLERR